MDHWCRANQTDCRATIEAAQTAWEKCIFSRTMLFDELRNPIWSAAADFVPPCHQMFSKYEAALELWDGHRPPEPQLSMMELNDAAVIVSKARTMFAPLAPLYQQ
jgi:hypothetical protein